MPIKVEILENYRKACREFGEAVAEYEGDGPAIPDYYLPWLRSLLAKQVKLIDILIARSNAKGESN